MKIEESKLNEIKSQLENLGIFDNKDKSGSYLISQGFGWGESDYIIRKLKVGSRINRKSNNEVMVDYFIENDNHSQEGFINYLNDNIEGIDDEKSKKYKSSYYNILKYMFDKMKSN